MQRSIKFFTLLVLGLLAVLLIYYTGCLIAFFPYSDLGNVERSIVRTLAPWVIAGCILEGLILWLLRQLKQLPQSIVMVGWIGTAILTGLNIWAYVMS